MIDHNILLNKLTKYDIRKTTLLWTLDFITDHRQKVKLREDCFSEWKTVPAGVPQRTKRGPWRVLVMINDLDIMGEVNLRKYLDDSTLSEVIDINCTSAMKDYVNEFALKSTTNGMQFFSVKNFVFAYYYQRQRNRSCFPSNIFSHIVNDHNNKLHGLLPPIFSF